METPSQTYERITGNKWGTPSAMAPILKQYGITDAAGSESANLALQNKLLATPPKDAQNVPPVGGTAATPSFLGGSPSASIVGTSDAAQRTKDEADRAKVTEEATKQKEFMNAQRDAEIAKLKSEVTPTQDKPVKPDYLKTFEELRASGGVQSLEDEMLAIKDNKRKLQDSLDEERTKLMGGVSESFFQGSLSTKAQEIQSQLNVLNRAEQLATDRLTLKNSYIDNVMKMTEKDYATASTEYNNEYSKNIQTQSMIANVMGKYETQADKDQTIARANLTTITNLFSNSGKTWDVASPELKAQVEKLELQAGIPMGTTELFAKSKPRANIIGTTTGYDAAGNQFTRYQYMDDSGEVKMSDIQYTGGKAQTPAVPGATDAAGKFSASLKSMTDDAYKGTFTREQVIAGLKAQYPEMKESVIESNVKALMPDGWEKNVVKKGDPYGINEAVKQGMASSTKK